MPLTITACNPDDSYGYIVAAFLAQEFQANLDNQATVMDAVHAAFIASGQVRQGPAPSIESQFAIRNAIRYWIERNEPIAVLVPWGSKKPLDTLPDIAELMALRQVIALEERVKKFYAPGISASLRVEDLGGYYLWSDNSKTRAASALYVEAFDKLVRVLGHSWLTAYKESEVTTEREFFEASDAMTHLIYAFLVRRRLGDTATAELDAVHRAGWTGNLPDEQTSFYLRQYTRYYPQMDSEGHLRMLARYLGQSWGRHAVKAVVKYPAAWGSNFVQVSFPQPVPGMPESLGSRRVYYRTLPTKFARTHLPPWRAKGYLAIENGSIVPKLSTVFEAPTDLHPLQVQMSDGRDTVVLDADYEVR